MRFRLLCALRRPYAIRWISLILLLKPSVIPLVERCRMERTIGSNQRCKVPATRCSDSWALWLARAISLHHASLAGLSYVRSHHCLTSCTQSSVARHSGKRRRHSSRASSLRTAPEPGDHLVSASAFARGNRLALVHVDAHCVVAVPLAPGVCVNAHGSPELAGAAPTALCKRPAQHGALGEAVATGEFC